jgi:hypothetical protein
MHYCRFIFIVGPKPLITTRLDVGGENSAVIIPIFTTGFKTGGENLVSLGPNYGPMVIITL